MSTQTSKHAKTENQGEGNREADRRYREDSKAFVQKEDVGKHAEKARDALDGRERDQLKQAEKTGREKAKGFDPNPDSTRGQLVDSLLNNHL